MDGAGEQHTIIANVQRLQSRSVRRPYAVAAISADLRRIRYTAEPAACTRTGTAHRLLDDRDRECRPMEKPRGQDGTLSLVVCGYAPVAEQANVPLAQDFLSF